MKFFKIDDDTFWEETGRIKIYNYPASPMTYSYIVKTYREYKRKITGWKEVDGKPIYFHEMTPEEISFAKIFAECQNNLFEKLSNKETFEIITENEFE